LKEAEQLMQKSYQYFADQLQSIRSSFISVGLVDTIKVPYQGQKVPISQIAFSIPKQNQICITPHDPSLLVPIADALKEAGFNAYPFSKTSVVVSCPRPSTDQIDKVIGQIKKLAEDARISIRSVRKRMRQQSKDFDKPLQVLTDQFIEKVDLLMEKKIDMVSV
jgi:ribosome recycling factor